MKRIGILGDRRVSGYLASSIIWLNKREENIVKRKLSRVLFVAVICVLLLGLTGIVGCATTTQVENTITIGAAVSLTGKTAYEGKSVQQGYEVWADWVNSHGGITAGGKNYKVKMIYYDDQSDATTGAQLTEKLITQDKVDFLFGPFSSAITFATTAIGEKYKKLTIAPEANATNVYERGYKYVFSVLPPAPALMVPIAELASKMNPKPKTVALITANDLFPISCSAGFRDEAAKLGFQLVLDEKYAAGATDISTLLSKVKTLNPDILVCSGYTADSLMVMKQCKELDVNPKMYIFAVGVMLPGFVQALGATAEYVLEGEWWLPQMKLTDEIFGTTAVYVKACTDKFGADYVPPYQTSSGTAAGELLQLAIKKADSIDTDKVRDALASLDVKLVSWPEIAFNEKGQDIMTIHPVIQVQNGKFILVYPEDSQEKPLIYPTPVWGKR